MATAYTKEFLVGAFLYRYYDLDDPNLLDRLEVLANNFYDQVGKDKFRVYCSLDAEAIKNYKESL